MDARAGGIHGFQICYQFGPGRDRALTWRRGQGFAHDSIDEVDERTNKNQTPILIPDGQVPWERIMAEKGAGEDQ